MISFVTGESIEVKCGVDFPDPNGYTYPGTAEELKTLIEKLKG